MLPLQQLNHPAPLTDIHCIPTHKDIPLLIPLSSTSGLIPHQAPGNPSGHRYQLQSSSRKEGGGVSSSVMAPRSFQAGEHPANWLITEHLGRDRFKKTFLVPSSSLSEGELHFSMDPKYLQMTIHYLSLVDSGAWQQGENCNVFFCRKGSSTSRVCHVDKIFSLVAKADIRLRYVVVRA